MRIGGFQKLTLIDYPGKIATTVFTVGCSFRCPFCHNPELVVKSQFLPWDGVESEFFAHLQKRKGKLDGVCITGGEPTIQPHIIEFVRKIKDMGYLVKLDTNGTRPDVLKKLYEMGLLDFVATDIKNAPERYDETVGLKADIGRVRLSVEMIMNSRVPYEFRTTVVPGIHAEDDFDLIADWIDGADAYYLQEYRNGKTISRNMEKITAGKSIDLDKIGAKICKRFKKFGIRKNL
jgi:pyruvate formate lyase activating enzyme